MTAFAVSFVVLFFISQKGEKEMEKLQTELIEKALKQHFRQETDKKNTRASKRTKERFSRREIEDLMGCNRAIYVKRGGAIRQR